MVKFKGKYFENDKRIFECMAKFDIVALTKEFIHQRLWNSGDEASVKPGPDNYKKLLQMMVDSRSYDEFIAKTKSAGSDAQKEKTGQHPYPNKSGPNLHWPENKRQK